MDRRRSSNVVLGVLLVLLGAWFLASQYYSPLANWINLSLSWPLIVIGVGVFLLVLGLLVGAPGMAVPACIVGGIGGLLYWQNATGNWGSWSYAWTLIPGFLGIGILLSGLLEGRPRQAIDGGLFFIVISLVMFAIFASFLGSQQTFGLYWPVLLILFGLWILARAIWRMR